jgi:hypothetical protein
MDGLGNAFSDPIEICGLGMIKERENEDGLGAEREA